MREYNINIPFTGLKYHEGDISGLQELKNLYPDRGYWVSPRFRYVFDARSEGYSFGSHAVYGEYRFLSNGYIEIHSVEDLYKIGRDPDFPLDGKYIVRDNLLATPPYEHEYVIPGTFTGHIDGGWYPISCGQTLFEHLAGTASRVNWGGSGTVVDDRQIGFAIGVSGTADRCLGASDFFCNSNTGMLQNCRLGNLGVVNNSGVIRDCLAACSLGITNTGTIINSYLGEINRALSPNIWKDNGALQESGHTDLIYIDDDSDVVQICRLPFSNPVSEVWFDNVLIVAGDEGGAIVYPDGTYIYNQNITRVASFDARLFYTKVRDKGVYYGLVDSADIEGVFNYNEHNIRDTHLNEDGYMYMPAHIQQIKRLGDAMVCYGDCGVFLLNEALGMPALGEIHGLPSDVGIAGALSVDGTLYQHVFVGTDGNVWRILHNFTAEKLGYDWIFRNTQPRVQLEPGTGYYWVGNYILTERGLGGPMDWAPRGMSVLSQGTIVIADPMPSYVNVSLKTNILDMANNGQKRITVVNVISEMSDVHVTTDYKYSSDATMCAGKPVLCSPEGAAFSNTSFVYGTVRVSGVARPGDRITKAEIRYQSHDRRYIRGTRGVSQSGSEEEQAEA